MYVTRRVKRYTRFLEKYVTSRRMRFLPYKVYKFLIRINSLVDLALSVHSYERRDFNKIKISINSGGNELQPLVWRIIK